jgi:predicted Zn-ribbon and HTH transcriptional regulator
MIKFRSPIYWEKKISGQLNVVCRNCGSHYITTFEKFKENKACPNCLSKEKGE